MMKYFPPFNSYLPEKTLKACSYFHEQFTDELRSLVPEDLIFTEVPLCQITVVDPPRFFVIARRNFLSSSLFVRTLTLRSRPPSGCFPEHNDLNLLESIVRILIFTYLPITPPTPIQTI